MPHYSVILRTGALSSILNTECTEIQIERHLRHLNKIRSQKQANLTLK